MIIDQRTLAKLHTNHAWIYQTKLGLLIIHHSITKEKSHLVLVWRRSKNRRVHNSHSPILDLIHCVDITLKLSYKVCIFLDTLSSEIIIFHLGIFMDFQNIITVFQPNKYLITDRDRPFNEGFFL